MLVTKKEELNETISSAFKETHIHQKPKDYNLSKFFGTFSKEESLLLCNVLRNIKHAG